MEPSERTLQVSPIGYIQTTFHDRSDAPHQPNRNLPTRSTITLLEGHNFEQALEDLEGMDKIWLLFWFDRNTKWNPKVLPPRSQHKKRGLFATRAPHRPNPIGLTLVDLVSVEGRTLTVSHVDLLDNTPIIDIKPYLPRSEAYPDAEAGWIDELPETPRFTVQCSDRTESQLRLLEQYQIPLRHRILRVLSHHIDPHPYKRIKLEPNGQRIFSYRAWRVEFHVDGIIVHIDNIASGYTTEELNASTDIADADAQRALFHATKSLNK